MSTLNVESISHPTSGSNVTINGITPAGTNQLGNRNLVINGAMQVAQRGTTFTGLLDAGVYLVDRFSYRRGGNWGTNNFTATQESSGAPAGFTHFLRLTQAGTAAAPPTNADCRFSTYLEGNTTSQAAFGTSDAQPLTLSFYARASQAGTYCVSLANGIDQTYMEEYSVTTSWQRFIVNIPARTTGTWNTGISTGFELYWIVAADSDGNQSGSTGWTNTNARYTTNQIETFASTSGATFDLCGVQLEVGSVATPFEHRSYGDELARCERYLQIIRSCDGESYGSSTSLTGSIHYRTVMRANPTVEVTGALRWARPFYGNLTQNSANIGYYDSASASKYGALCTFGNFSVFGFTGPLSLNDTTNYITASAEL
jgi:hypothetical protein